MPPDLPPLDRRAFIAGTATALAATTFVPDGLRAATSESRITGLRADYLEIPLGLENRRPALSWRIESGERNLVQSACRVTAAGDPAKLAAGQPDLWDSGRIETSATCMVTYAGRPLQSRQRVFWRVEAWDGEGQPLGPSPMSWWEMGLLEASDWSARWLAAEDAISRGDRAAGLHWIWGAPAEDTTPRRFRFRFSLSEQPVEAVLLLAVWDVLGGVWLKGDGVPFTPFRSGPIHFGRMLTIPIEPRAGDNLLAVETAIRDSSLPLAEAGALAAVIRVRYADGRYERVSSGTDWLTHLATHDPDDWTRPSFDDRLWPSAQASDRVPLGEPWPAAPAMLLRRDFRLERSPRSARLYVTALGSYEARINGARVGEALLAPESTDFRKRVLYRVHDVAKYLRTGENVLGAIVGDGWYGSTTLLASRFSYGPPPRRLIAQLEIVHDDGTREIVASDSDWREAEAPVRAAEIYDGEVYDARREQPGWDAPGFDDSAWQEVMEAAAPQCRKVAQPGPPIRAVSRLEPVSVSEAWPGVFVYDFGQNFAGWCRLEARAPAGTTVELRFAELVDANGNVDQTNLRSAEAREIYTFRGDPSEEVFEPHFTYHGFRYVSLTGFPGKPPDDILTGVVLTSDMPATGKLRVPHHVIDRTWRNTLWSQRSNFFGVPTDCPQRDERLGWLGDAQVFADAASFNADVNAFLRRFMADVRDAQLPNGAFSDFCPTASDGSMKGSPGWADAGIILPWTLWWRYGDTRVIDENWDAMVRYSDHVLGVNPDFVWQNERGADYGDWLALDAVHPGDPTTPKDLVATAYWARTTGMLADMAAASGRNDAAQHYSTMRKRIAAAFVRAFIQRDGTIGNGSQTSYILPLHFGLVPHDRRVAAAAHLAAEIRGRGTLLSTGFLGTPHALDVLADNGYVDLVYALLRRTDYPSWGYMIEKGATTIWERWNGDVGDPSMNSFNHYALGAVVGFFYRRIAGIDAAGPAFSRIRIRPLVHPALPKGGGDFIAMPGCISTDWTAHDSGRFQLSVSVPPNCTAEIHLPAKPGRSILESGWPAGNGRREIRLLSRTDDEAVLEVGSGHWRFEVR